MSNGGSRDVVYAAAEGREFLRDELEGKSNEWVNEFAGLVESRATLDLLNHYCSVWREARERGRLPPEMPDRFLDTATAKTILTSASTVSMDSAFNDGNVSKLKGVVGMTGQRKTDSGDWLSEVVDRLTYEGAIGLVLGPPGAGKTALTLDVARMWGARTGGAVIGNTSWDGFDHVVTSDADLLEAMGHTDGPVLAVIDETAQDLSGFGSANKAAEAFSDALTFVRKQEADHGPHAKRGSVLMVNHTRTKTAKPFRDLCNFAVEKPHRTKPNYARILESEGGKDTFEEGLETDKLTDTRERYSEHEASEFHITALNDDDGDESEQVDTADVARSQALAAAIRAVQPWSDDDGMTYADAGAVADYSAGWVSDRIKEWRQGDHRDLVPDPRDN